MTSPGARTPTRLFLVGVLACMALGFGIRWVNIAVARPVCDGRTAEAGDDCYQVFPGPNDPVYGYYQGVLITEGEWFVNPYVGGDPREVGPPPGGFERNVGDPPLYQLFLASMGWLGVDSAQGQRHASAVVGLLAVPLLALLARRLAGDGTGLLAAFLAAVHPLLWINDGMLLSEALYAPLVVAALLAAIWFRDGPNGRRIALVAFLVCAAAFTRGEAALLLVLLIVPLVLGCTELRPWARLSLGAVALAVTGLWFLPWNLWLNAEFSERVFMTTASGSVLSASACDEHFYGDPLALFIYCPIDVQVPEEADASERDAVVRDAATSYIEDNLDRLPVVAAARVGRTWNVYGPAESLEQDIETESRGAAPSRVGLALYYALVPFSVVGLVSLHRRGEMVWPYLALAVMVSITAASTFGLTRYRVPVDAAMVAVGAVGITATVGAVRERLRSRTTEGEAIGDAPPGDEGQRLDDDA